MPVADSGEPTNVTIPTSVSAGRIWLAQGSLQFSVVLGVTGPALVEPSVTGPAENATTWGFVEFTYTQDGVIYVDTSYVDFVSMNLGLILTGADIGTQTTPGLELNAIQTLCEALADQAATDGYPWNELCITDAQGQPVHVLAPDDYIDLNADAFSDYWSSYVDQVWSTYAGQPLIINSQSEQLGNISCTVSNDLLTCTDGSDAGATFAQPSAMDIFSCASGPFALDSSATDVQAAVAPRLCAAFNRSTFLLDGGNIQPDGVASDSYYSAQTTNWYSKLVHQLEIDGRGYAFAYDDVTPDSEANDPQNQSGEIVSTAVPTMRIVRLGVIVPSSNTALEPLTNAIVSSIHSEGLSISVHFSRFRVTTIDLSPNASAQFQFEPILSAARLLADAKVDVIGWSGTSAGWLGFEHDERLCAAIEAETGIKTTTSVLSLNALMHSLGVTSIGLVTPYIKGMNDAIRANYAAIGIDISGNWERHLGITDNNEIVRVDESTLDEMVMDVAANGALVLTTFCTNLRAAQRVEYWEKSLRVTVLDSVSTTVWGMLKMVGVDTRLVKGWGFMFEVD
ncbi:hypothetical protein CLAIMM_11520 [Cladophialophora immunda]|nr:hypothetical protein CLAIMM_11520 [Cladophialophora immunda]